MHIYTYICPYVYVCVYFMFFSFQLTCDGTAQRTACSAAERMACCLVTFDTELLCVCVCVYIQAGQSLKQTQACKWTDSNVTASVKQSCWSAVRQEEDAGNMLIRATGL